MAIKCNVVTVSASSSIPKDQRVTLCGADSITLTLPVFDDIDITSNTRFVVVVPAGSGFVAIQMATPDALLFDANGLTTYTLPSEGQFEFCVNNSRWYSQLVTSIVGGAGTVTSVDIIGNDGILPTGGPITTSGSITLDLGAITPTSVAATGTVTGSNLSGTNTGDQTITLTTDVTGSGTGSFAATIAADAVTYAKMQNASANVVITRAAASSGDLGETALGAAEILGRGSTGDIAALTLGPSLSITGTTLDVSSTGISLGLASMISLGVTI